MERRELLKLVALTALSPKVNVLQAAAACHMDAAPSETTPGPIQIAILQRRREPPS